MTRLWFKDGTYMDAPDDVAKVYENDPEWDHSEPLDRLQTSDEPDGL